MLSPFLSIADEGCADGDVRLVGGEDDREGRVEVCYGGIWGAVDVSDPYEDAAVACRQLGYDPLGE